jgi:MFS transporter, BCD family, chlorophyll transporter
VAALTGGATAPRGFARWLRVDTRFLPFADAASAELSLPRLLRLSLFQVSVGMCLVLLTGTLNRVMIVEQGISAALVATLVALPLLFAPLRALLGYRSDQHRSALGWRRVPYIWFGSLLQFGGLAIMPFALVVLSGDTAEPTWVGVPAAALAFLLVGAGLHTTQTAGLALATDLAPDRTRPRVVALLYVMLLLGTLVSAVAISALLRDFSAVRLIQVLQGAALAALALNACALWKQEARAPQRSPDAALAAPLRFRPAWQAFMRDAAPRRYFFALATGTAAFAMQDVLLEPYGGAVLGMSVSATTGLTALLACGTLIACAIAARALGRGADPVRLAAAGCTLGLPAFAAIIFSAPLHSTWLFGAGALLIGLGAGLFALGMLTVAMSLQERARSGLALGAWGAVQASAAGLAIFGGGALQELLSRAARNGLLGEALSDASVGYLLVYHLEIALLFAALVMLGPLLPWRRALTARRAAAGRSDSGFGLAEFPG